MWHSEADIINDLAALNDFGDPENTEPYKILGSIGRGLKAEKKTQPNTLFDPRTGEEVELDDHCLTVEDMLCRGKGRGSLLGTRNYTLLHKQLRLARPLGSSDEVIESYFRKSSSPEQVKGSPEKSDLQSTDASKKSEASSPTNSVKMKSRVKAVRSSNLLNNALITSLLKSKEITLLGPGMKKSKIANEPEILDSINEDCAFDFQKYELLEDEIPQIDSGLNNLFIWENDEDAHSESVCISSKSSNREETEDKIKGLGDDSFKSVSVDLSEDFNSDFSADDEDSQNSLKRENGTGNISDFLGADQKQGRDEMYKRLGEKLNKKNLNGNQRKKQEICFPITNTKPVNKGFNFQDTSDFGSFPHEYIYDELDFPPLA